jgi:hypothetical protein
MMNKEKLLPGLAALALGLAVGTTVHAADKPGVGNAAAVLDHAEETHLIFMREEEKLARDVYLTFAQWYPAQPVFQNIGEGSEQTHTDTMRDKLEQYRIADPNPDANDLPASIGVFTGEAYGGYFTEKFQALTALGAQNELSALYVGALIEELDMHDIVRCPKVIVETDPLIEEDGCGLNYTDEKPLINSYSALVDGSENHLRAYVGQIEAVIGAGNYVAQYLTQEQVDVILGR